MWIYTSTPIRFQTLAYGRVDEYIHIFLTSALVGSGQLHASAALPPGKEHSISGRVGPRTGVDDVEKIESVTNFT
jgi:hypothetical protein